jgi:predicted phosphoribosyltransferase
MNKTKQQKKKKQRKRKRRRKLKQNKRHNDKLTQKNITRLDDTVAVGAERSGAVTQSNRMR